MAPRSLGGSSLPFRGAQNLYQPRQSMRLRRRRSCGPNDHCGPEIIRKHARLLNGPYKGGTRLDGTPLALLLAIIHRLKKLFFSRLTSLDHNSTPLSCFASTRGASFKGKYYFYGGGIKARRSPRYFGAKRQFCNSTERPRLNS
jgi:hypothetical protein